MAVLFKLPIFRMTKLSESEIADICWICKENYSMAVNDADCLIIEPFRLL